MNTIKTLLFLALLSAILIWAGGAIGGKEWSPCCTYNRRGNEPYKLLVE
ncbi:MAG: hypothetical protein KatS3mg078_2245 [Deltaproteobacteria bacterium]|nr:MAG: hypothetical protein KatS3mg078_2245 [Deltaproteobacteria bacterium]